MTATISSTVGGSAGCRIPLLRGVRQALWPGIAAGERRRPVASSNTDEEDISPFESRSLTILLYRPSTYDAAVVSLLLAGDATGAE